MIRLYSWRGIIISLLLLAIPLMVCGVLHLTYVPESEPSVGNMETYTRVNAPALPNLPVVPIETAIPNETMLPDGIVKDILPINEYSRPGIELSEVNGVTSPL